MDNNNILEKQDANENPVKEDDKAPGNPFECDDSEESNPFYDCDDDEELTTPSVSLSSSSSSLHDDINQSSGPDESTRIPTYLAFIFNFFPQVPDSIISYGQLITLILIATLYSSVLKTESRTFGWRGALSTFGLQLHIKETVLGRPFYDCKFHHLEETVETQGIKIFRQFPHTAHCDYFITWNSNLLGNIFIVGGAMIINIIYIYLGKGSATHLKVAQKIGLFYPLLSIYFLAWLIMDFYDSLESLKDDMYYELDMTVLPDTISTWWRNTQIVSECCGGLLGPRDWKMATYKYSLYTYQYHSSCLHKTYAGVSNPNLFQVWQEGCIEKERSKILFLSIRISILMFLQGFFGTCLILNIIRKTMSENHFSKRVDFEFECEKLKGKVRINVGGEVDPVLIVRKSENVLFRINCIANADTARVEKIPSICAFLFYSTCVFCLLSKKKKICEVVFVGAKDAVMPFRLEQHDECNFVQLTYDSIH